MKIVIHTFRKFQNWPSYHLVYEWEDIIKSEFEGATFCEVSKLSAKSMRIIALLGLKGFPLSKRKLNFCFEMTAKCSSDFYNRTNVIPSIIDFFLDEKDLLKFEKAHEKNPVVLISSKEVYEWLKLKECKNNIVHWALSLPDKYKIIESKLYAKKYDFVLVGRTNSILTNFLEMYVKEHPNITYVYEGNKKFHYYTNHGEYVGYFKSRDEYMRLNKMSKIALYSTPSMDDSRKDANGFNQVTPKFLEYIACECHLILRYPNNPDTEYYDMNSFCPSIETYEQFESKVDEYLKYDPDIAMYSKYLIRHYTSTRVEELKLIFGKI